MLIQAHVHRLIPRDPQRSEMACAFPVVINSCKELRLYGAIGDGAIAVRIPKNARKELEAYLVCGLLCRGFARLKRAGCASGC
jgi:hypothetical protein